ncbi:MAG: HNH endonuclease [Muribaculaceae bacterium]|nr:HNH endonuclease [Muribaculaceae bacterium]
MKIFRIVTLVISSLLIVTTSSCKKSSKEVLEKITSETVEKTAKEVSQEATEKTLKNITKKELHSLDWSELIKLIRKENINLAEALNRLDKSFQKKIGKAIQSDYDFYSALVSSNSFVDEFVVFTKNAPKAANNVNIFKYFVKCRDLERRFGVNNALGDLCIKEETGIVKFFRKSDNSLIGEMRDGIFLLNEPFKTGSNLLDNGSVLKKTLIPNSVYKIKGANGLTYLYHVDDIGRFSKIEAKSVSTNELMSNVIFAKENYNLGSDWTSKLRKVSQTSKGNDIDATLVLKYADDGITPLTVKADIKANNKKIISESFENIDNLSHRMFTTADNASLLDRVASKTGLSIKKKADLLNEMGQDDELAKLIHSQPEFNIKRWLISREKPNKSLIIARKSNGGMPPNWEFSGKSYYLHPSLNPKLKSRFKDGVIEIKGCGKYTLEDFAKWDKLYPEGIPFTKEGFADFSNVAFKGKDGKPLVVTLEELTGDSKKDISLAKRAAFKLGYPDNPEFTWHHIEYSTSLMRVPYAIHELVRHAGGMSTHAAQQIIKQAA